MLARERVVRPELGEEGDHQATDQVLALSVVLLLNGLLQPLQRRGAVALVPGLECRGELLVAGQ